jgi:hypothetical protein
LIAGKPTFPFRREVKTKDGATMTKFAMSHAALAAMSASTITAPTAQDAGAMAKTAQTAMSIGANDHGGHDAQGAQQT